MAFGSELPDDLVADVLRCLPPRSLAVSRCVCRAWRDLVDARRLLRADLLPRTVGGIFINYYTLHSPQLLVRPTTGPSISGDFEFIHGFSKVMDHCNGLVLCNDYVVNPATRQWAQPPLPPEPDPKMMMKKSFRRIKCLVYDPTMSPHYDVFLIRSLYKDQHKKSALKPAGKIMMQCEGLQVYVYSSRTDRWEERWFAPEGRRRVVETTIAEKKLYWRGALYLLTDNGFVLRISISNAKYKVIPTPVDEFRHDCSLGKSEKGVYCAFTYDWHRLQIFLLNESCGQMVWELRHSVNLRTFTRKLHAREDCGKKTNGSWILQDINYCKYPYGNDLQREAVEDNFEDMVQGYYKGYTHLLGFHPYREIVFLNAALSRAVAYHWNTSKFQNLGNLYPKNYCASHSAGIDTPFIYTPCWMEDFPKNSLSAPIQD